MKISYYDNEDEDVVSTDEEGGQGDYDSRRQDAGNMGISNFLWFVKKVVYVIVIWR